MIKGEYILEHTYLLPYHLQFFADAEKTEEPTGKKLLDARKEGQVARSTELITSTSLVALFLILKMYSGSMGEKFISFFKSYYQCIDKVTNSDFNITTVQSYVSDSIIKIIIIGIPIFLISMAVNFIIVLIQVKWKITPNLLKPKFNKINPISGFKKIISMDKVVDLIKEIIKIVIIIYIAYSTLKKDYPILVKLYGIELNQAIMLIGSIVIDLGLRICSFFMIIGFADLFYQKMKFKKDMRMSKQEVKDEYKNSEGDPLIKNKIKQKMREVSQRRMMQALPQADVVITNPTHLAAAIKYDKETSAAPILLAKGADYLAQKIKDAAKENNIEIIENKPLARMLYYNVEIGDEIPPELYQMTAEVLAYVYGIKNRS